MNVGATRVCLEGHVRTRSIRTVAPVHKDTQDMIVRQVGVLPFISGCHFIEYIHIIIFYYNILFFYYSYMHLDIKHLLDFLSLLAFEICIGQKLQCEVVLDITVIIPAKCTYRVLFNFAGIVPAQLIASLTQTSTNVTPVSA